MAKTVVLDGIGSLNATLRKDASGAIGVEVSYLVLSGSDPIKTVVQRDITPALSAAQRSTLSGAYDQALAAVRGLEL